MKNLRVAVTEAGQDIVFLHRVEPGPADRSYGIEVARLAGLPRSVIERARQILQQHERAGRQLTEKLAPCEPEQAPLFTPLDREIVEMVRSLDLDHLRPIEALQLLAELKKRLS